jgi:hypothetical protein
MPSSPTPEEWAQIRHEYEQTRRSIEDICLASRISANTLRRRVKLWGWTMRQPPIADRGPPGRAEPDLSVAEEAPTPPLPRESGGESFGAAPSPQIIEPSDTRPASERLQAAVARVMRAIELTSARLTASPVHLRETELAARALGSLTRTLRELNELLTHQEAKEPTRSVEELRRSVARKLEAIIAESDTQIPEKYHAASSEFAAKAKQGAGSVL